MMAGIHNRKLIAAHTRELKEKDVVIGKLEERILALEEQVREMRGGKAKDVQLAYASI